MALQGWWPRLVEHCMQQVPPTDEAVLNTAAAALSAVNLLTNAEQVLNRMQNKRVRLPDTTTSWLDLSLDVVLTRV